MGPARPSAVIAAVLVVVAKAPVPGRVKTRLQPELSPDQAAEVAAAALLDTLDVVHAAAATIGAQPVLALSGDLADGAAAEDLQAVASSFRVVAQRGESFADRLVAAHLDAAGEQGSTVQVGMDTPQLRADQLVTAANRVGRIHGPDAVLGPASDGGWWLLALRRASSAAVLGGVVMSSAETGDHTLAALRGAGLRVELTEELRDVDHTDDLMAVADSAPATRFAALVRQFGSAGLLGPS